MPNRVIVAITGASGSIYAKQLIEQLAKANVDEIAVIFSENGQKVWEYEIGRINKFEKPAAIYNNNDMFSPMASGSAGYNAMVVVPCTMGTLGRIAAGTSPDLICRATDVILKERKKLILVPRELPYSLIHIENMKTITLAGGIILPASPSFYSIPQTIEELTMTVIARILDILEIPSNHYKWGKQ